MSISISTRFTTNASEPISASVFGDEFNGHGATLFGYNARYEVIGSWHLRWPGSISVEDGIALDGVVRQEVFDISSENIYNWDRSTGQREGLAEVMAVAVERNQSFAMTLPTSRYAAELIGELGVNTLIAAVHGTNAVDLERVLASRTIADLRHDVRIFIDRLLSGQFGEVPTNFTLEVGTEYYTTHVWNALVGDQPLTGIAYRDLIEAIISTNGGPLSGHEMASAFGLIFAIMTDEISDAQFDADVEGRNSLGTDIQVSVQAGAMQRGYAAGSHEGSAADNDIFISAFREVGSLQYVDSVIWHRYAADFAAGARMTFGGQTAEGNHENLSLRDLVDEWNQGRTGPEVDLIAGWMAPGNQADPGQYGARSLNSILQMFTSLVHQGVDIATIYGTDGFGDDGVLGALGSGVNTYIGGKLFSLMTEILPGSRALNFSELETNIPFITIQPGSTVDTPVNTNVLNTFTFANDSQLIIFLSSGDFGSLGNGNGTFSSQINIEGQYSYAWSTHLFDPGWVTSPSEVMPIAGIQQTNVDRGITYGMVYSGGITSLSVTFAEEFEVIRLVLSRSIANINLDISDSLCVQGLSTADTIVGRTGNDRLFGGAGNDRLIGNAGDDVLDGGDGIDFLFGGDGNDTYYLDSGDVWSDVGDGIDTVITEDLLFSLVLFNNIENITYSGSLAHNILGNAAGNLMIGGSGGDTLSGSSGDDTLTGGGGVDRYVGGVGNDTYRLNDASEVTLEALDAGNDIVEFVGSSRAEHAYTLQNNIENLYGYGTYSLILSGNHLSNYIQGTNQDDSIFGGFGNDTLKGMAGQDLLNGGSGNDVYIVGASDIVIELVNQGVDTVQSLLTSYTLGPWTENLLFVGGSVFRGTGNEIANYISSGSGHDLLYGLGGNDHIFSGSGSDSVYGGGGSDSMHGGSGNDTYFVDSVFDVVLEIGSQGTDTIVTSLSSIALAANVERLVFAMPSGANGFNAFTASNDQSLIPGFVGFGNGLANTLIGSSGSDSLYGAAGSDCLIGGRGDDVLVGGSGMDMMTGSYGNDRYFVDLSTDRVIEESEQGIDTVVTTLANYVLDQYAERLVYWGIGDFTGVGNEASNTLVGSNGEDSLLGNGGQDSLYGGFGNDFLGGGTGTDYLFGELGDDRYYIDRSSDRAFEKFGQGTDTIVTFLDSYTLQANIERLLHIGNMNFSGTGNALANQIVGGSCRDTLYGLDGNDILDGAVGHDYLSGGNGSDTVFGGYGNDILIGNDGFDLLSGGVGNDWFIVNDNADQVIELSGQGHDQVFASVSFILNAAASIEVLRTSVATAATRIELTGNGISQEIFGNAGSNWLDGKGGIDTMTGGSGSDHFVFSTASGSNNFDTITDFSVAADTIELENAMFGGLSSGVLAASAFKLNSTGYATDSSDRIVFDSSNGYLYFDADGTGNVDRVRFAVLDVGIALTNLDVFVF